MSEWLKETGCKPVGSAYAGSNPAPPIDSRREGGGPRGNPGSPVIDDVGSAYAGSNPAPPIGSRREGGGPRGNPGSPVIDDVGSAYAGSNPAPPIEGSAAICADRS